jgi:hypothetical protein
VNLQPDGTIAEPGAQDEVGSGDGSGAGTGAEGEADDQPTAVAPADA